MGRGCVVLNELTHFIEGKHIKGTSGRFSDVFTPMTGEISAHVPLASPAEVRAAVKNAKAAQPAWAATNPQQRARVLRKFIDLLNRDLDNLAIFSPASTARRFPMRRAKSSAASKSSNLRSVFLIS